MLLTKTTGHGGQLPDTVGNDFHKSTSFFQLEDESMHSRVWSDR